MVQIIPTVFEKDFPTAEARIKRVREYGRWIQVDVTDGIFTFGKSFELELLNHIEKNEDILWDIHLMVKEPIKWIEKCLFVGASRIIGQVEMMENRDLFIKTIKDKGIEAGLAFDIDMPVTEIPDETDLLLLMARKAGFEEKNIDEKIFEKIKKGQGV